uniref:NADH-ubiquinone oxidoreductase chain 4L n=1 Tax=Acerella muscorum TaxID=187596 RepID=A0A0C4K5K1_9HEXA|nr:NADH dehydrogenase subunit 4L [Acerella muscorum]AHL42971.1 NADH dehydrogenase subunit 4L [Acerella muscorum]
MLFFKLINDNNNFFMASFTFMCKNKNLIHMLLILEFMILLIYSTMCLKLSFNFNDTSMILFYLIFSVCESVLGISMLIFMVRSFGSDYLYNFSFII